MTCVFFQKKLEKFRFSIFRKHQVMLCFSNFEKKVLFLLKKTQVIVFSTLLICAYLSTSAIILDKKDYSPN